MEGDPRNDGGVRAWLLVMCLAGCGRIGFAGAPGDDVPDGGDDGGGDGGAQITANRVFVTSLAYSGALGGIAGADQKCSDVAAAAGLSGPFLAFVSSTNEPFGASRFDGSRGWVRMDGAPVFDTLLDASAGKVFNPIDRDEAGARVAAGRPWTGTDDTGGCGGTYASCADWTVSTSNETGAHGSLTESGLYGVFYSGLQACNTTAPLVCLETGRDVAVAPTPGAGRIVFASSWPGGPGLSNPDGHCQNDAANAGLSGTFRAAVATTSSSIASKFTADARAVRRVDGTIVANDLASFMSDLERLSFVNQRADGTYFTFSVWTGASNATTPGTNASTCSNWTSTNQNMTGTAGFPGSTGSARFWNSGPYQCSIGIGVVCLEN